MQKRLFLALMLCFMGMAAFGQNINPDAVLKFKIDQQSLYRNPQLPLADYYTTYINDEDLVTLEDLDKHYPLPSSYYYDLLILTDGTLQPVIWDEMGNSMGFRVEAETLTFFINAPQGWVKREIEKE